MAVSDHFAAGDTGSLEDLMPYFRAGNILRRNLEDFNCQVPPIVLDLTFYNLWAWGIPAMIQTLMPDLKKAVLRTRSKSWNCVWLVKMSNPDCERIYCNLIFFGNKETEPESPRFREVMLDLMHQHEELTGYNIAGLPSDCGIAQWLYRLSSPYGPFTLLESGEINPQD